MPDTIINGIRIVKGGIKQRSPQIIPLHYPSERVDYKTTTVKATLDSLKTVAFSGSYNDLSDKPSIPATQVNADWNATSGVAKILNKPTIPTVNNATLTIQKNGTTVKTFTANASSNVTCNITVPTTFGDLTGTVAIGNGGTGATTRLNALKNLTNENVSTNATYFLTITNSWGKGGYTSVADVKTVLGLGSLAYKNSLSKSDVGLGNVNNTADANKSVNYANSAGSAPANGGNADTVDGSHAWNMQTLSASGSTHGASSWVLKCQHNVDGDGRFKFVAGDGSIGTKVDYANSAGAVAWGSVTGKPTTFTPSSHTHDDRYYTESEINTKLSNKSDVGHTHSYLPLSGGDLTGSVTFKNGKGINLYNAANNNFSDIVNSDNGTLKLRSAYGWLNLQTNNQVQCRNFGDSAWVNIAAANISSSRRFKENIKDLTKEEAKKILNVRTVTFDFKEEYAPSNDWEHERYNQSGVIAEEVLDIYPTLVRYSNYEEPDKPAIPTFVEYSHFVPYLIKMVQIQQREIDDLKSQVIGHNS